MNPIQRKRLEMLEAELEVVSFRYVPVQVRDNAAKVLRDLRREMLSLSTKTTAQIDSLLREYDEKTHRLYPGNK